MFDLDLLRSFVAVADAGGFTRGAERVHRTQSAVSQQIRKLEDGIGKPLFERGARRIRLTDEGERLLGYARRLLRLSDEARDAMTASRPETRLHVGVADDFAVGSLAALLSAFARTRGDVRLEVRCGLSVELAGLLELGEIDLALVKREPGQGTSLRVWPERLHWIASREHPLPDRGVVPLVAFPQGCLYRDRAIHALETAGRPWRIAYTSPNLLGIQAAVAGGLGVAVLERRALLAGHRVLGPEDGFPAIAPTELALLVRRGAPEAARDLAREVERLCAAEEEAVAQAMTGAQPETIAQEPSAWRQAVPQDRAARPSITTFS
ncbi:LysR substrate-binding domain-containing protein [Arenibaculum sp.]|jgi:DNA-binding transcriptional LysR family regulator|uniref:LysR substrate-binding domain-containing protein n=1 Tax=Arenibaculum sp. TaxID=2865862 RepID=UPI002E0D1773|nr:LysR substrate-binding domain-containing protein [Arenibaculum sp.]